MKKGFTLAEVLITLAVIGVVAALTITTVVGNYQKIQFYTQFMKMYKTLSDAVDLSVAKNGNQINWVQGDMSNLDYAKKYYTNYLNVATYCTLRSKECGTTSTKWNHLNYEGGGNAGTIVAGAYASVKLQNGSNVYINEYETGTVIYADTNGADKGPNTWGRDLFTFVIKEKNGVSKLKPYDNVFGKNTFDEIINGNYASTNCSTTKPSIGNTCGARLLLEGKMNY